MNSNNTRVLLESWRKFLNEARQTEFIDVHGSFKDVMEGDVAFKDVVQFIKDNFAFDKQDATLERKIDKKKEIILEVLKQKQVPNFPPDHVLIATNTAQGTGRKINPRLQKRSATIPTPETPDGQLVKGTSGKVLPLMSIVSKHPDATGFHMYDNGNVELAQMKRGIRMAAEKGYLKNPRANRIHKLAVMLSKLTPGSSEYIKTKALLNAAVSNLFFMMDISTFKAYVNPDPITGLGKQQITAVHGVQLGKGSKTGFYDPKRALQRLQNDTYKALVAPFKGTNINNVDIFKEIVYQEKYKLLATVVNYICDEGADVGSAIKRNSKRVQLKSDSPDTVGTTASSNLYYLISNTEFNTPEDFSKFHQIIDETRSQIFDAVMELQNRYKQRARVLEAEKRAKELKLARQPDKQGQKQQQILSKDSAEANEIAAGYGNSIESAAENNPEDEDESEEDLNESIINYIDLLLEGDPKRNQGLHQGEEIVEVFDFDGTLVSKTTELSKIKDPIFYIMFLSATNRVKATNTIVQNISTDGFDLLRTVRKGSIQKTESGREYNYANKYIVSVVKSSGANRDENAHGMIYFLSLFQRAKSALSNNTIDFLDFLKLFFGLSNDVVNKMSMAVPLNIDLKAELLKVDPAFKGKMGRVPASVLVLSSTPDEQLTIQDAEEIRKRLYKLSDIPPDDIDEMDAQDLYDEWQNYLREKEEHYLREKEEQLKKTGDGGKKAKKVDTESRAAREQRLYDFYLPMNAGTSDKPLRNLKHLAATLKEKFGAEARDPYGMFATIIDYLRDPETKITFLNDILLPTLIKNTDESNQIDMSKFKADLSKSLADFDGASDDEYEEKARREEEELRKASELERQKAAARQKRLKGEG